jgi:hypothetical protein
MLPHEDHPMSSIEVDGFYTLCLRDAIRPMHAHNPSLNRAATDLVWFARSRGIEPGALLADLDHASRSVEWVTAFETEIHGRAITLGRKAIEEAFAALPDAARDGASRNAPTERPRPS